MLEAVDRGLGAALHAELREQRRHVVLDRLLGEPETLPDLPVGEPLRDEVEHLALAQGELGLVGARGGEGLGDARADARREQGAARGDLAHALDEPAGADLLEHVAGCSREHGGPARLVVVVGGEDEAPRVGVRRADGAAQLDAVAVGEPHVEHDDIRPRHLDLREGAAHLARLADHLEVALGVDEVGDAAPHDLVVVDEEDADHGVLLSGAPTGAVQRARVPPPSRADRVKEPPRREARSSRLRVPDARVGVAGRPTPSSATVTTPASSSTATDSSTRVASAWRVAFARVSRTTANTSSRGSPVTSRLTGPLKVTSGGFARPGLASPATSSTRCRSAPSDSGGALRAKIAVRISPIAASIASTCAAMAGAVCGVRAATACRARPVPNRRWMTWSCRSRAIRARSSMRASRSRSARPRAGRNATPVWAAKSAARARSASVKTGASAER